MNESFLVKGRLKLRYLLAVIGGLCFAFPPVLALCTGASFLAYANESAAYRFFLSERILNGEGASAWIWQGFLTSAIQTSLLWMIEAARFFPATDLLAQIDLFSNAYALVVAICGVSTFILAARRKSIRTSGIALMLLAILVPMFLTGAPDSIGL